MQTKANNRKTLSSNSSHYLHLLFLYSHVVDIYLFCMFLFGYACTFSLGHSALKKYIIALICRILFVILSFS